MQPINAYTAQSKHSPLSCLAVIGATSGIGKAFFDYCEKQSVNHLISISRRKRPPQSNPRFEEIEIDLASSESVQAGCQRLGVMSLKGERAVGVLVSAATIDPINSSLTVASDAFDRAFLVNCLSPLKILRTIIQVSMEAETRLRVVYLDTGAADRPILGWGAYCASKAAMRMALRVMAAEADPERVQIDFFDPGIVDTPMQEQIRNSDRHEFPDRETFRAYKNEGKLRDAESVALDIWERFCS